MLHTTSHPGLHAAQAKGRFNESFIVFSGVFVLFLVIALLGAVLGGHWRAWLPGAEGVKSVTGGVKAAAYTVLSHLP